MTHRSSPSEFAQLRKFSQLCPKTTQLVVLERRLLIPTIRSGFRRLCNAPRALKLYLRLADGDRYEQLRRTNVGKQSARRSIEQCRSRTGLDRRRFCGRGVHRLLDAAVLVSLRLVLSLVLSGYAYRALAP